MSSDMDDRPAESSEWDRPIGFDTSTACRRAAAWTWTLGVAGSLFCGSCTGLFLLLALLSPQELEKVLESSQLSAEQTEQMMSIHTLAPAMAVSMLILGLVPAMAYLGLGFGVRRGSRATIGFTLLLATTQTIVLALLAATLVFQALRAADPLAMTVNVLLYGTGLMLLGFTIYWLWQARRTSADQSGQTIDEQDGPNG